MIALVAALAVAAAAAEPAAPDVAAEAPAPVADVSPRPPEPAPDVAAAETATPQPCTGPSTERAPDPRCGESLDGRAPPEGASAGREASRAVLWVPRAASRVVFFPLVKTSGFVEEHHVTDWIHAFLTSDDGKVGVRPLFTYSTSFLPTVGARLFYRRLPAGAQIAPAFRTAGPSVILAELDLVGPVQSGLTAHVLWNRRIDRLFAGIGPNSKDDLAERGEGIARYASDIGLAELRWTRPLPRLFAVHLHSDAQRRDYRADKFRGGPSIAELYGTGGAGCAAPSNACVNPMEVPGFQQGLRIVHAGGGLAWDGRSHDRDGSGFAASVDGTYGQGVGSDDSRHVAVTGEVIGALGGNDRLFLLRGRGATVGAVGSAPVPFEELVSPSGILGMRGFPEGRFRGGSGLVGSAEYRWYVSSKIDATLFADVGSVSVDPGFRNFRADRWFPDVGVGLRLLNEPALYWEAQPSGGVEVAYSPDAGVRILFAVAPF